MARHVCDLMHLFGTFQISKVYTDVYCIYSIVSLVMHKSWKLPTLDKRISGFLVENPKAVLSTLQTLYSSRNSSSCKWETGSSNTTVVSISIGS